MVYKEVINQIKYKVYVVGVQCQAEGKNERVTT